VAEFAPVKVAATVLLPHVYGTTKMAKRSTLYKRQRQPVESWHKTLGMPAD